jgi:TatD DNase family protein
MLSGAIWLLPGGLRSWLPGTPSVFAVVGIHPHDSKAADSDAFAAIRDLTANDGVVALGEMGLDYHYDFSPRKIQQRVFRYQIKLARAVGIAHCCP